MDMIHTNRINAQQNISGFDWHTQKNNPKGDNHNNINVSIQWVKKPLTEIVKLLQISGMFTLMKFSKK